MRGEGGGGKKGREGGRNKLTRGGESVSNYK